MNFFDATVVSRDTVDAGPLGKLLAATSEPAGANVLIAVRPEKITVAKEGDGIKGTIAASAYLGERNHLHVLVDGVKEPVAVAQQNQDRDGVHYRAGDAVALSWAPESMVTLPPS
jgi:ABC-type Fe3+/spermidine/putrescine transport system ATPase subunit